LALAITLAISALSIRMVCPATATQAKRTPVPSTAEQKYAERLIKAHRMAMSLTGNPE
jgi:hypothetical protein